MFKRWTTISIFALICTLLASCGNKSSNDDPLPPSYKPAVYVSSDNQVVYSFNIADGSKNWEYNATAPVISTPLIYQNVLYIFDQSGYMHVLDPNTGKMRKKIFIANDIETTPIGDSKFIFVGAGDNYMYALDTSNNYIPAWKYQTNGPVFSSPTLYKGDLIFGSDDGHVYCLDEFTGSVIWNYTETNAGKFKSSPMVSAPFVYAGNNDGNLYSIDITTGTKHWIFGTPSSIESSPIFRGGNVIFGSDDYNLYCVDTQTAVARWVIHTGDRVVSSPLAADNLVFFGSYDNFLYAANILDGKIKWKFQTGGVVKSSPVLYQGIIYFGSYDRSFYSLDTTNSSLKWKQSINGAMECSPIIDDKAGMVYNPAISGYVQ